MSHSEQRLDIIPLTGRKIILSLHYYYEYDICIVQ